MSKINCIESYVDRDQNHFGSFIIEPLETGQGITVGNALRRTMLSDLTGYAVTGARINNIKHEFAVVYGLREDVLEVLLNLKELVFKPSYFYSENCYKRKNKHTKIKAFLKAKGPKIITAGMFCLPREVIRIVNPSTYICTIVDNSEIYLEIDIENGRGYQLIDQKDGSSSIGKFSPSKPTTLRMDAVFLPIKKANFKVKLIHDSLGNIKESLIFEVVTNGSITPKRGIEESLQILLNLFYPLFIDEDFLKISSELAKSTYEKIKEEEKQDFISQGVKSQVIEKDETNP